MNVMTKYEPANARYRSMGYRKVGRSGLQLPMISLGHGRTLVLKPHLHQFRQSFVQRLIMGLLTSI